MHSSGSSYVQIYDAVCRIPEGCVATYGDVADMAGLPGRARLVGYALYALEDGAAVPWHRVVNARGALSVGQASPDAERVQRRLLEAEGIEFGADGRLDLRRYRLGPA